MITKLGKQKLEKHIFDLRQELTRTVEERAKAAYEGDLKENSAYIFLGERAEVLRSQIVEAEGDLKMSIIQDMPLNTDSVNFGHSVTIRYELDKREITITLVGKNDARLKPGWISVESPVGLALKGKKINEQVTVNDQLVTILHISQGDL
ncbi:MAG: GreA/GreB family elongation factor [Candidatus Shapirobacteria bacterium]|jgi:transcription elongation GreA/GreB family factor